jgi:predicted DNA-binding WGR domain protein
MTTMPSVSTETMFMLHSGGTKFYEITLINAADLKTFLVVKRWGKIEAIKGGGEVQVLDYSTPRTALQAAEKLKNDKEKRGYQIKDATHGLGGSFAASGTADILSAIKGHYTKHWPMVLGHLGLDMTQGNEATMMIVEDDLDPSVVFEQPPPEPDRGDSWGSW